MDHDACYKTVHYFLRFQKPKRVGKIKRVWRGDRRTRGRMGMPGFIAVLYSRRCEMGVVGQHQSRWAKYRFGDTIFCRRLRRKNLYNSTERYPLDGLRPRQLRRRYFFEYRGSQIIDRLDEQLGICERCSGIYLAKREYDCAGTRLNERRQ